MAGKLINFGAAALIASLAGACAGKDAATFDNDAAVDVPAITATAKRPVPRARDIQMIHTPKVAVDIK